jgi:4-amino-4-deoxy-L-arabinose transferase-like glycosyltransferase
MLQAFLVLPAFALVYLVAAPGGLARRVGTILAGGAALAVSAGWWPVVVSLVPMADRPYVDNSTNDSIWSLILGYNGLGRIFGGGAGGAGGGGFGFGGGAGLGRLFDTAVGGQISWFLWFAGLALVVGLATRWRAPRTDLGRAGYLLWGGWAVVTAAVFSLMTGTFHPYYTVALAPAIGALVGMGVPDFWRQRRLALTRWLLPAAIAATGVWAFILLSRTPEFVPWLRVPVLAASLVAALVLLAPLPRWLAVAGVVAGLVAVLAGPAAYVADTIATAHSGAIVSAGPATTGFGGGAPQGPGGTPAAAARPAGGMPGSFRPPGASSGAPARSGFAPGGGAGSSTALVNYLVAHRGSATWIAAEVGSNNAAGLELASRQPVMAMGGFLGSTSTPTLSQFKALVSEGKIRYLVVQSGGGAGGAGRGGGGSVSEVVSWAEAHGQKVTISGAGGVTVYDLQGMSGT